MNKSDGQNYAPDADSSKVVKPGEFAFAATHLDHGHIYGMVNGLKSAGATLKYVFDNDPQRIQIFKTKHPEVTVVDKFETILGDPEIKLVASAAIPNLRARIGETVMKSGKNYFADKSPFTTLGQLNQIKEIVSVTKQKYMVYYSERLHVESAMYAQALIDDGVLGRILHVTNLAPHRLARETRPEWFFDKAQYGGILTDIGSHQFEQFLSFTGAKDATINFARAENFNNPDFPGLEDFGEASLTMDNGAACYCRLDWFSPDGQSAWGDGRVFIVGTKGTLEIRKYTDIARSTEGDRLFLTNATEEKEIRCQGLVGYSFFGELILDCIHNTENAMTQSHAFKAAELAMQAQAIADSKHSTENS